MLKTEGKIPSDPTVAGMLEDVLGCKWSLQVLQLIRAEVCRPGAMARAVPGLSAKVLNERLVKLKRYGILDKVAFAEIPPRVEYRLTLFGLRFVGLLDQIKALEAERPAGRQVSR